MQYSSSNYNLLTVDQLKCLDIKTLSKVEKLKLKNSKQITEITNTQECTSKGLKFIKRLSYYFINFILF